MTREEAIRQIENRWSIMDYGESEALGEALDMAIEALSAERTGEWVTAGHTNGLNGTVWAACSICGSPGDLWDKYCRACGAKMDGGNHE